MGSTWRTDTVPDDKRRRLTVRFALEERTRLDALKQRMGVSHWAEAILIATDIALDPALSASLLARHRAKAQA